MQSGASGGSFAAGMWRSYPLPYGGRVRSKAAWATTIYDLSGYLALLRCARATIACASVVAAQTVASEVAISDDLGGSRTLEHFGVHRLG